MDVLRQQPSRNGSGVDPNYPPTNERFGQLTGGGQRSEGSTWLLGMKGLVRCADDEPGPPTSAGDTGGESES
jgi:hypothetical protein